MKTKQRKQYPDLGLLCELCGKTFKSRQGLAGHRQLSHSPGAVGPSSVAPAARTGPSVESSGDSAGPSSTAELRGLKAEVERLQLELKKRKLQGEFPAPVAESPDIMQRSGLGSFTNEAQVLAQRRALGVVDQGPAQSWLDKLLSNPESLKLGIDALKGILGVRDHDSGDQTAGLLKSLGLDLKDLISGATAPKAGEGLTIGGVSLAGASLTPELLKSVLEYKAAEEKAKGDFESRKLMADALQDAINALVPAIADLQAGRQGGAPGPIQRRPGAGPEVQDPEPQFWECPRCGHGMPIPDNFPGGELRCQTKLADGSTCLGRTDLEVIDNRAESKAREKRKRKPEPEANVACPGCGQLVEISGKAIGDKVCCPVCQVEFSIISDTQSVPAAEPLTDEEKRSSAWRDAFKQGS